MSQNPSHRVGVLGAIACGIILFSLALAYGIWAGHGRMQRRTAHKTARILCPPRRPSALEPGSLESGRAFTKGDSASDHGACLLLPHDRAAASRLLPSTPPHAHVPPSAPFAPPGLPQCKNADSMKTPVLVITKTPDHQSVDVLFYHADSRPAERMSQPPDEPETSDEDFGLRGGQDGVKETTRVGTGPSLDEADELICDSPTSAGHPDVEGAALSTDLCPDATMGYPKIRTCTARGSPEPLSPPVSPSIRALVVNPASMHHERPAKEQESEQISVAIPTLILSSPGPSSARRGWGVSSRDAGHGNGCFGSLDESPEQNDCVNERKAPLLCEELQTPPQSPKTLDKPPIRSHIHSMRASIIERHSLVLQPYRNTLKHPRTDDDYDNPNKHSTNSTVYARPAAVHVTNECLKRDACMAAGFSSHEASGIDYAKLRTRGIVPTMVVELARRTAPSLPRPARCVPRPRAPGPRPGYI